MKTVAIVGFAQDTFAEVHNVKADTEVWSVNYAWHYDLPRIDRLFEIHELSQLAQPKGERSRHHYEWLHEEHPFPIYMLEDYPDIPSCVPFPFDEIESVFKFLLRGNSKDPQQYLTSTMNYMLALAILEGFERIELYGIRMYSETLSNLPGTEYTYQKAGFEHICGIAEGRGIYVWVPEKCPLFDGRLYHLSGQMLPPETVQAHAVFYGAHRGTWQRQAATAKKAGDKSATQHSITMALIYGGAEQLAHKVLKAIGDQKIGRQDIETIANSHRQELDRATAQSNYWGGRLEEREAQGCPPEQIAGADKMAVEMQQKVYVVSGGLQAAENMIRAVDLSDPPLTLSDITRYEVGADQDPGKETQS